MSLDNLPLFHRTALLLDFDGTLVDLAPRPDAVVVPPDLPDILRRLRARLGGALATVSGRPVEAVDALLDNAPYAAAGEHGVTVRHAPGEVPRKRSDLPTLHEAWLNEATQLEQTNPGALLERKTCGFALHYRGVPEAGPGFRAAIVAMLADSPAFELLAGHMLWEVRPRGVDKGGAVRALMERPPFAGRLPLFIGDDQTDEDGIRAARAMGGAGLRVDAAFATPDGVRRWLRAAADSGTWPALPAASLPTT